MESVVENVDEFADRDIVIPTYLSNCGECTDCKSDESNLCSTFPFNLSPWMPVEDSSRFTDVNRHVSSFSEYSVVKIDHPFPPDRACLLGCGVSTGKFFSVESRKGKRRDLLTQYLDLEPRGIGLLVAEGARIFRASTIIGIDINPDKFKIGRFSVP